jgi:hypothetical protein
MNKIKFSTGTDPAVVEVFSPFSGQLARVHRHPSARSRKPIVLFPGSGGQIMRVPKLGNYLENGAFAICGGASLAVLLMTVLGVN